MNFIESSKYEIFSEKAPEIQSWRSTDISSATKLNGADDLAVRHMA